MRTLVIILFLSISGCVQKEKSDNVPNYYLEVSPSNYASIYIYEPNIVYYPPDVQKDSTYLNTYVSLLQRLNKDSSFKCNKIYFNLKRPINKQEMLDIKRASEKYFQKKIDIESESNDQIILKMVTSAIR